MIQGCWVTQDRKYSAWPPEADKLDPLEYDKYLQSGVHEPQPDWVLHPIRIRAYSDDFSKVRLKLRTAEVESETDLNSAKEDAGQGRRTRGDKNSKKKTKSSKLLESRSSDEDIGKIPLPKAPVSKSGLTFGNYSQSLVQKDKPNLNKQSPEAVSVKKNLFGTFTTIREHSSTFPPNAEKLLNEGNLEIQGFDLKPNPDNLKESMKSIENASTAKDTAIKPEDISETSNPVKVKPDTSKSKDPANNPAGSKNSNPVKVKPETSKAKDPANNPGGGKPSNPVKVKPETSKAKESTDKSESISTTSSSEKLKDSADKSKATNSETSQSGKSKAGTSNVKVSGKSDEEIGLNHKDHALKLAQQMSSDDFKAFMILNLSEIRTQLKALTLAVSKSKAVEGTSNNKGDLDTDDIGCDDDTLHGLPAIDMETWQQFNDKLTTDIKFRKAVAQKIKNHCFGQATLQDFVRASLALVISNSLASEFSWAGVGKKAAFHGFYFVKLLSWVLKHRTKFPRVKDDLKSAGSAWLRLAPQRAGGLKFTKYRKSNPSDEVMGQVSTDNPSTDKPSTSTPISSPKKSGRRRKISFSISPGKHRPSPLKKRARNTRQPVSESDSDILPGSGNSSLIMYDASDNDLGVSFERDEAEGDPKEFDDDDDD